MTKMIREEIRDDLRGRGFSRRQMMRAAMMFGGAATAFAIGPEIALAQPNQRKSLVQIGANECWTGPLAPGLAAVASAASQSNRYSPHDERGQLIKTISQVEKIPQDHIMVWPGSNAALAKAVLAYCSPTRGVVTADPTYETVGDAARFLGAPVKPVPLKADYSHDVKAMLAADPHAAIYYVCNPNNPTGTMTPTADIEWLVNNKPAGSVVMIDEAYIHWTTDYPGNSVSHLAVAGKDVIVARTFSKIFGMAGMRVGYLMARPDIIKKVMMYDDGLTVDLPIPSIACANASLTAKSLIDQRRAELIATRTMTEEFLKKRGLKLIGPSHANMLMVDWKTKTAKEMKAAFLAQGVEIARVFPSWPTVSRISIGSKADMEGFFAAFNKVVAA